MRFFWSSSSRVLAAFEARLRRFPLAQHPAFYFNPRVEGSQEFVFGGRAGPQIHINNLFHELAHAAQFGPEAYRYRQVRGSFVFKVPQHTVLGERYPNPMTAQSTFRELETFAYQLHLLQSTGFKTQPAVFFRDATLSMRFMVDWFHVPGDSEEARHAFCEATALAYYAGMTQEQALARLEGWLDKAAGTLNRTARLSARWHANLTRYRLTSTGLNTSTFPLPRRSRKLAATA